MPVARTESDSTRYASLATKNERRGGGGEREEGMPHLLEFLLCIGGRILVRMVLEACGTGWTDGKMYGWEEQDGPSWRPCDRPS